LNRGDPSRKGKISPFSGKFKEVKMAQRILVKGKYVISWQEGEHVQLNNATIVIEGDTIKDVSTADIRTTSADQVLGGSEYLIMPGFINLHTHMFSPITRSFLEDVGSKTLGGSTTLYEYLPRIRHAANLEDQQASTRFAIMELLKGGNTTVIALQTHDTQDTVPPCRDIAETMDKYGVRGYISPMFACGHYYMEGNTVKYAWDDKFGERGLQNTVQFLQELRKYSHNRIRAMFGPRQTALVSRELLIECAKLAAQHDAPIQLHCSESIPEVKAVRERYQCTPVELVESASMLRPRTILGHCIYVPGHSLLPGKGRDLELIAGSGASVAHCPWIFGRRGVAMESFQSYRQIGINLGIGTDTFPQDMFAEMRCALTANRLYAKQLHVISMNEVYDAATVGGAKALGREDLGRITAGAKADLIMLRLDQMNLVPVRDPLKSVMYSANSNDVDTVMVAGKVLVQNGKCLYIDEGQVKADLQKAAERVWKGIEGIETLSPRSLRVMG
jgi:cytosine/adenosine deaminase-related metal-dependent hydrolase